MLSGCYEPLSPRKPQGLPYLQPNRVGRLSYVRRIAPELQSFASNRKVIRPSLGLSSTDPAVIQAWNRVHREEGKLAPVFLSVKAGMTDICGSTDSDDWWMADVIYVDGGARDPKVPTLFQVADVDTGVVRWGCADLVTQFAERDGLNRG